MQIKINIYELKLKHRNENKVGTWLSNRIVEGGRLLEILESCLVVLAHHVIPLQVDLSYNKSRNQSINLCIG